MALRFSDKRCFRPISKYNHGANGGNAIKTINHTVLLFAEKLCCKSSTKRTTQYIPEIIRNRNIKGNIVGKCGGCGCQGDIVCGIIF